MVLRFFVYPKLGGLMSESFDTLVDAIRYADPPEVEAVIVQAERPGRSGLGPDDIMMARCEKPGRWMLTEDGEQERGTAKLLREGLLDIEDAEPAHATERSVVAWS